MSRDSPDSNGQQPDELPAQERFEEAFDAARTQVDTNLERFDDAFPGPASEDYEYPLTDCQSGWTPSFWTGILWLCHDVTGGREYEQVARDHVDEFATRLREENNVATHDIGFMYSLSAVPAAEILGDDDARELALAAADRLAERFLPIPGIIQAWGDISDPDAAWPGEWSHGRMIVDTMMNLPLLFWAAEERDDEYLRQVAVSHAVNTADHLVREDGSTFHTFRMNPRTGEPVEGETHQGHADDSCWARGQAWTLYGMATAYRYTGRDVFRECAEDIADYYLAELPDDLVPYWDLDFGEGSGEERDSSAGAIAACGLLELSHALPDAAPAARRYHAAGLRTLASLADSYTSDDPDVEGLITNGVYNKPSDEGVEEATIWGDYFYLEGLVRATDYWEPYW